MNDVLTNVLGALLGIYISIVFFETLWVYIKIKRYIIIVGMLLVAFINVILTTLLLNSIFLPFITITLVFTLSFFFTSGIISKLLFTLVATAIHFVSEVIIAVILINILDVQLVHVQDNTFYYFIGVVASNMCALLFVYIIKIIMKGYIKGVIIQFNILLLLMPVQSIIICFFIYVHSISVGISQATPLGIITILVSLVLVFITMFVVNYLQKSIAYKNEFELAKTRLETQIDHYQKLYEAQYEIRAVRHNINNELIAISGMLESKNYSDAKKHIDNIIHTVNKKSNITNTGIPALDAVIDAKIDRANNHNISIKSRIRIDSDIKIDGFDIAGIVAGALDNAIEGIQRSERIERTIWLNIVEVSGFISILVENYSTGIINEDYKTSKSDKQNHGFGLTQMIAIAKKYGGDVHPSYNLDTKKFTLKVLLKN